MKVWHDNISIKTRRTSILSWLLNSSRDVSFCNEQTSVGCCRDIVGKSTIPSTANMDHPAGVANVPWFPQYPFA